MKRFLKSIAIFTICVVVFYPVLLFFWFCVTPQMPSSNLLYQLGLWGHTFTRFKEVKTVRDVDILVLGSSHACLGFDPRVFKKEISEEINVFNLGSHSQTHVVTKALLERYLDKLNPKVVIYEVYPEMFSCDSVESAIDIISNDRNDISSIKMAFEINHMKVWNTLIVASIRDVFEMNSSFVEPIRKPSGLARNKYISYVSGGYTESEMSHYKPKKCRTFHIDLDEKQISAFKKSLSMLKERGIRVVLVYAPVAKLQYRSIVNGPYFDDLMSSYGEYYNFNELMNLDDKEYFIDKDHLNQEGVELFNKELIDVIFSETDRERMISETKNDI